MSASNQSKAPKKPVSNAKKIFRIVLLVCTAISLYFVPWSVVWAYLQPLPDTIQEQVDDATNKGFDGIIVYVDQKGKAPKTYTAGYHNTEKKIPARPDALFKIASNDKLYTALAIAKLVRSGKLSLDKTLADYFPELADRIEYSDKITIRMMVQHRSGIPNYTNTYMYWVNPKDNDEERLDLVLDTPASFEPDTDYEYSNTNYLLLSYLIEKASGSTRFEYLKKEVLTPLGLNNTYGSIHDVDMDDVMSGYYVGYDADLKTDDNDCMLATAEDLGKFLRALNEGTVFTDQKERDIYSSIYRYDHTGLIPGYQSISRYHKELDAVVIQFTNTVNFEGYNWNISEVLYNRVIKLLKKEKS